MPFRGKIVSNLLQNPSIQRMPKSQRDWNSFVQNLELRLAGDTGTFDPTFGAGFSADPSGALVHWKKVGTLVLMAFYNASQGTSDAGSFSITGIPANLTPVSFGVAFSVPIIGLVDNGVESWGSARISSAGTITFGYESTNDASWTGTGSKGWSSTGATIPTIVYDTKFTLEEV